MGGYPRRRSPRLGRARHRQASPNPTHRRSTKCQPRMAEPARPLQGDPEKLPYPRRQAATSRAMSGSSRPKSGMM
jgi:hypothetical protein